MRIRVSNGLALVSAIGLAVSSMVMAHAPTYASSPGSNSLTNSDFHQIALQGFGYRGNSEVWSMAWYNNRLYVGDNRFFECDKVAMLVHTVPFWPYPPLDPNISCPHQPGKKPLPSDLVKYNAAEIWSLNPVGVSQPLTQSDWTLRYADPNTMPMTITDGLFVKPKYMLGPRDIGWRGMTAYTDTNGPALFISGVGTKPLSGKTVLPPALMRYTDSGGFHAVPSDPGTIMGDINTDPNIPGQLGSKGGSSMRGAVDFNGHFVIIIGSIGGSGALFSAVNPSQGNNAFVQLTPPSMHVFETEVFNGHLYLGIENSGGYTVMRTDCVTPPQGQQFCPASAFTQIVPPGGGLGSQGDTGVLSMHVFTDPNGVQHLYVGCGGAQVKLPGEIIRINTDDTWDLIMGNPRLVNGQLVNPLSGITSGFGFQYNWHMWRMTDYHGTLYVGTYNDAIRLLHTPQGKYLIPFMGFNLWASDDGVHFTAITTNGFGDMFSYGIRTMVPTDKYGLFLGIANEYFGLRVYQGMTQTQEQQSAPSNLQADTVQGGRGSVSLAWTPGAGDTVFHIYRSTESQVAEPVLQSSPLDPSGSDGGGVLSAPSTTQTQNVWVPSAYTEIGTSTSPYFVDTTSTAGGHYQYYVTAQDASGTMSEQSNTVIVPTANPLPTFRRIVTTVKRLESRGKLTAAQAASVKSALNAAHKTLKGGDALGALNQLEALRQQIQSGQAGITPLYAERLTMLIGSLEQRVSLVHAQVLSTSSVN